MECLKILIKQSLEPKCIEYEISNEILDAESAHLMIHSMPI